MEIKTIDIKLPENMVNKLELQAKLYKVSFEQLGRACIVHGMTDLRKSTDKDVAFYIQNINKVLAIEETDAEEYRGPELPTDEEVQASMDKIQREADKLE